MTPEYTLPEANSNDKSCQWINELLPDSGDTSAENIIPDISTSNVEITPEAVLQLINDAQNDEKSKDRISVLPLMCGTGKSSALRLKMKQIIEANDGNGMIVVTDSIDRMRDYLCKGSEELNKFFSDHRDQITVMTHTTIEEDLKHQAECPILIMSTQRFTNLLPSQLDKYLTWNSGSRPLVIVDERPYFYKQIDITVQSLYQLHGALKDGLPLRGTMDQDRRTILEFWDAARLYLEETLNSYSNKCDKYGQYYFYVTTSWNDADRFYEVFALMEKYRNFINNSQGTGFYSDVYTFAQGAYQLLSKGALLSIRIEKATPHKRKNDNISMPIPDNESIVSHARFSVLMDNFDKYAALNAKVIILDGTADLSPEYEIYDNIDMRTELCAPYKRSLSRLYIDIYPKRSGKTVLEQHPALQKAIVEDVHSTLEETMPIDTAPVVFSYKFMQDVLHKYYDKDHCDWFGNIKGKNDYRAAEHIAQIGLHRFPAPSYFLLELAKHHDLIRSLPAIAINIDGSYYEHSDLITKHINDTSGYTQEATYREILTDLEQNMFRGTIRNSNNQKDYHFYLFASVNYNRKLIEMIKQRYEALGAHVIVHERPDYEILKSLMERRNANGPTRVQRLVYWHDKEIALGREYRYADISEAIEANSYQVRQIRKDNPVIDRLFNSEVLRKEWKNVIFIKKSNWYFCDEENEEYES